MTEAGDTVLVVDDEVSIREPLAAYLSRAGLKVEAAASAAAARDILDRKRIDLILLDIMMPGEDGLSLVRTLRADGGPPVILVTARSEDTDRIVGLELGADDYVVKPFNPRELLARIKAVLRRTAGPDVPGTNEKLSEEPTYRFGRYRLDTSRRLLEADGEMIELTGGEYGLLLTLIERAGRVLNRDQLLDLTQGRQAHVFDRSIDNQVSRLRRKIEDDPKNPGLIKTVRGGGYVFADKVIKS